MPDGQLDDPLPRPGPWAAREKRSDRHWARTYQTHAHQLYETERAVFENSELARHELDVVQTAAARMGATLRSPILDLACGPGRHCLELGRRGYAATGLDFSPGLLTIAHTKARAVARTPTFSCGDMRSLPWRTASFRSALLLGNSFGYYSDTENLRVLQELRRVLRPGGFLALGVTNKTSYLASLEAFEEETIRRDGCGPLKSEWWRRWDEGSRRLGAWERHTDVASGAVVFEGPYEIRLFGVDELEAILVAAGFDDVATFAAATLPVDSSTGDQATLGMMGDILIVGATV